MPTATVTKKYNTTDVHAKRISVEINRTTFNAICNCNHLTPASEAAMENLLVPGLVVVPTRSETIERNSPGFVEPAMPTLTMPVEAIETEDEQQPPPEAYEYDRARASR